MTGRKSGFPAGFSSSVNQSPAETISLQVLKLPQGMGIVDKEHETQKLSEDACVRSI